MKSVRLFGAKRFTYRIDVIDFDAGHLAIEVTREGFR
jgi:hypothetical protein